MDFDPFGPEAHNKHLPTHSGKCGHYCDEFDGLWICNDCPEAEVCTCILDDSFGEDRTPEQVKRWNDYLEWRNTKNTD